MTVLLIDNYDSFVYNLARYVRELGETPLVRRHDAITVDEILDLHLYLKNFQGTLLELIHQPDHSRG